MYSAWWYHEGDFTNEGREVTSSGCVAIDEEGERRVRA